MQRGSSVVGYISVPFGGSLQNSAAYAFDQAAQRCNAILSLLSFMTFTSFLISGIPQQVLEGFAGFIADEQGCQWSVRPDGRRFELSFDCEIGALRAARVQRGLKAMGATDCPCIAGQTRPRVVLPSI